MSIFSEYGYAISDSGENGEFKNINQIIAELEEILANFKTDAMNPYSQSSLQGQKEIVIQTLEYLKRV